MICHCPCVQWKITKCLTDVGLTAERDVMTKKLSGGQKRKLSLAMAIIADPPVDIFCAILLICALIKLYF